jgi:hypothetical protein
MQDGIHRRELGTNTPARGPEMCVRITSTGEREVGEPEESSSTRGAEACLAIGLSVKNAG